MHMRMKGRWFVRGLGMVVLAALFATALSFIVMELWNWLVPTIIGWKTIDFWQALGLLVLTRLLVGFRGGFWHHRRWHGRMAERWDRMTPEEREKFRAGMHSRCGHHHHDGPHPEATGSN
jgi:hypothetical protein